MKSAREGTCPARARPIGKAQANNEPLDVDALTSRRRNSPRSEGATSLPFPATNRQASGSSSLCHARCPTDVLEKQCGVTVLVLPGPPPSRAPLRQTDTISRQGDSIDIDAGMHPTARAQAAFFVPTPPTDENLLLFSSASSYTPPVADPLFPWLSDLACSRLGDAVTKGRELRRLLRSTNTPHSGTQPDVPTPPCAVAVLPGASSEPLGHAPAASRSGSQSTVGCPGGVNAAPTLGEDEADGGRSTTRAPARREPNQVICRGLWSVDELMLAWEDGYNGYLPMKTFKKGKGGKLDRAQINLLSKAYSVWKKVDTMGREEFRTEYEIAVGGVTPTLTDIRARIERENRTAKKRTVEGRVKAK